MKLVSKLQAAFEDWKLIVSRISNNTTLNSKGVTDSMGNAASNIGKDPIIARSNPSAPGVLRLYNLEDHVFPYKVSKSAETYPSIHLASSLASFEKLVLKHLPLSPRLEEITGKETDIYHNVVNKEETAREILASGERMTIIRHNPKEDRNQVYMCRQFVVEITEGIGEIRDLKVLQACCNYLTRLPRQIGCLTNLRVLVLSKNRIQSLPDEIGLLKNLRELNLSQNLLSTLPRGISALKALNALHIDDNLFTTLPSVIGRLYGLKYLNISNNRIQNIPLEILKLPFLIELTALSCDFASKDSIECIGDITLKETCSRHLIRNNLKIQRNIHKPLIRYLLSVQECSFCGGPLFEHYYLHRSTQTFDSERFPIVYKLCVKHYVRHEDRIATLFLGPLKTYPQRLIKSNMPFVGELFNHLGYNDEQKRILEQGWKGEGDRMPLICLSKYVEMYDEEN
ncbi:leucine repeat-rich protein [Encephalitozoon hellem]|nr:leucine repeat-rich protein [Encephalitozoon hellem]